MAWVIWDGRLVPAKYRHLLGKRLAALLTLSGWTASGRYMTFGVIHRHHWAGEIAEFFPIPGYSRREELNVKVMDFVPPIPSLRLVEAELDLGLRQVSAMRWDYIATLFIHRNLRDVTAEELMALVNGRDSIEFEVEVGKERVPVVIRRVELPDRVFKTAIREALSTFKYNIYNHLPVLLLTEKDGERAPVGFFTQIALVNYLLPRRRAEDELVECGILFEDFNTLVPVVVFKPDDVKEFLAVTRRSFLAAANLRYAGWFEMLTLAGDFGAGGEEML